MSEYVFAIVLSHEERKLPDGNVLPDLTFYVNVKSENLIYLNGKTYVMVFTVDKGVLTFRCSCCNACNGAWLMYSNKVGEQKGDAWRLSINFNVYWLKMTVAYPSRPSPTATPICGYIDKPSLYAVREYNNMFQIKGLPVKSALNFIEKMDGNHNDIKIENLVVDDSYNIYTIDDPTQYNTSCRMTNYLYTSIYCDKKRNDLECFVASMCILWGKYSSQLELGYVKYNEKGVFDRDGDYAYMFNLARGSSVRQDFYKMLYTMYDNTHRDLSLSLRHRKYLSARELRYFTFTKFDSIYLDFTYYMKVTRVPSKMGGTLVHLEYPAVYLGIDNALTALSVADVQIHCPSMMSIDECDMGNL